MEGCIDMLEWNEIIGIDNNINHFGNRQNCVVLPEINEEVLFCRSCFYDESKDMYFRDTLLKEDMGCVWLIL